MAGADTPVTALAALRTAVGVGAWATPGLAGKAFGLRVDDPEAVLMARLFGVRDVALAAATLASTGPARRTLLQAGLACDLFDAAAALLGRRSRGGRSIGPVSSALVAGVALAAAATGVVALREG